MKREVAAITTLLIDVPQGDDIKGELEKFLKKLKAMTLKNLEFILLV